MRWLIAATLLAGVAGVYVATHLYQAVPVPNGDGPGIVYFYNALTGKVALACAHGECFVPEQH
jgi:hypothetical protein